VHRDDIDIAHHGFGCVLLNYMVIQIDGGPALGRIPDVEMASLIHKNNSTVHLGHAIVDHFLEGGACIELFLLQIRVVCLG